MFTKINQEMSGKLKWKRSGNSAYAKSGSGPVARCKMLVFIQSEFAVWCGLLWSCRRTDINYSGVTTERSGGFRYTVLLIFRAAARIRVDNFLPAVTLSSLLYDTQLLTTEARNVFENWSLPHQCNRAVKQGRIVQYAD